MSGRLLLAHKLYPAVLLGRGMAVSAVLSTVTVNVAVPAGNDRIQ